MAEGNGVDLGSIYGLLLEVAKTVSRHDAMLLTLQDEMRQMRAEMATKADIAAVRRDMAADMASFRSEVATDFAALRQTVNAYHSTVLGHGILISELDGRVRRVEHHLDLPPYEDR